MKALALALAVLVSTQSAFSNTPSTDHEQEQTHRREINEHLFSNFVQTLAPTLNATHLTTAASYFRGLDPSIDANEVLLLIVQDETISKDLRTAAAQSLEKHIFLDETTVLRALQVFNKYRYDPKLFNSLGSGLSRLLSSQAYSSLNKPSALHSKVGESLIEMINKRDLTEEQNSRLVEILYLVKRDQSLSSKLLTSSSRELRILGVQELVSQKFSPLEVKTITGFLALETDTEVKKALIDSLANLLTPEAERFLIQGYLSEPSTELKQAYLETLWKLHGWKKTRRYGPNTAVLGGYTSGAPTLRQRWLNTRAKTLVELAILKQKCSVYLE